MRWFWEYMVRFAPFTVIITFLLVIGVTVLTLMLSPLPDFKDPTKGAEPRGTHIKGASAALHNLLTTSELTTTPHVEIDLDLYRSVPVLAQLIADTNCSSGNCSPTIPSSLSTCDNLSSDDKFQLTFTSRTGTSLYTVDALKAMCEWVKGIQQLSMVNRDCPVHTLAGHVSLISQVECEQLTVTHLDSAQHLLTLCAPYVYNGTFTQSCFSSTCPLVPQQCTRDLSTYQILNYLADKYFCNDANILTFTQVIVPLVDASEGKALEFYDQFSKDYNDTLFELVGADTRIKFELYGRFMKEDFIYIAGGLTIVLAIAYVHTGCFIITLALFFDVIFSYALAYFIYFMVFRQVFFPFLNLLAAILIVAIAADDVFLFYDILQQERKNNPDSDTATILERTFKHAGRSIFTTSFTTASALYATTVSNITIIKCFAIFSGTAIVCNFVIVMTFVPSMIILQERATERWCPRLKLRCLATCMSKMTKVYEQVFKLFIPWLLKVLYPLWIVFYFLVAMGALVAVYYRPKFDLPTTATLQFLDEKEITERYDQNLAMNFLYEQNLDTALSSAGMPVDFVWGVIPEDNGNPFDPEDTGVIKMDRDFDMASSESQAFMTSFCTRLKNAQFAFGSVKQQPCTMGMFNAFMQSPCMDPTLQPCCGQTQPPFQATLFRTCFPKVISALMTSVNTTNLLGIPYFDDQGNVVAFRVSCLSKQKLVFQHDKLRQYHEQITSFVSETNEQAPAGAGAMFVTTLLSFYDLQLSLTSGTYSAFGISLTIALIAVLISTRNILTTIYSMITITLAIFVTIATLTLDGWGLNIFESIILSLAIGLSVDFTIHYSIAYLLATDTKTRSKKVSALMSQVGSSVAMAALTTFVAGIPVMWSRVRAYQQLGQFLMVAMSVSWTYATFFLLSVCRAIGPVASQGSIQCPTKCKIHHKNSRNAGTTNKPPAARLRSLGQLYRPQARYMLHGDIWNHKAPHRHNHSDALTTDRMSGSCRIPRINLSTSRHEHLINYPFRRSQQEKPGLEMWPMAHPLPAYPLYYHQSVFHSPMISRPCLTPYCSPNCNRPTRYQNSRYQKQR